MSYRRYLPVVVLSIALSALAGCASGQAGAGSDGGTASGAPSASDTPSAVGTWRAEDPGTAWLRIGDDGTVTGSDGCNGANGTAILTGDAVEFTMGLSTLKACSGVTLSFRALASGQLAGDTLTVRDRDGADLVELHRATE